VRPNTDEEDGGLVRVDEEPGEDDRRAGPGVGAERQWALSSVALFANGTFIDRAAPAPHGLMKAENADAAGATTTGRPPSSPRTPADLAAAYRRAFVAAVPTYSPPDDC
jgi:hypothetical protein